MIMLACCSLTFAQESASEIQAKQEIENFLTPEISAPTLPDLPKIHQEITSLQNIELSTQAPEVEKRAAVAPEIEQMEPSIVLLDPEADIAAIEKEEKEVAAEVKSEGIIIDLDQVFSGSPTIYTVLFFLSISALTIGAYAFASLRTPELLPTEPLKEIREKLLGKQYDEALALCRQNPSIILFKMVASSIQARALGASTMHELMKAEGKRASNKLWQRISLLNDIAILAPMLGLLGTVLGMFYAFYDLNRSMESISALFDGLGISVGTTVGGLIVAIIALFFHTLTKQRLMRQLILIEQEASSLASLIDTTKENI